MRRVIILAALASLSFAHAACAAQPVECLSITEYSSTLRRDELIEYRAKECFDAQKTLIERLERKFNAAVEYMRDPLSLVRGLNFEVMRKDDSLGPKFTTIYRELATRMGVDRNADEEHFPVIRSALSDPQRLTAFLALAKPVVRESVKRFAIVGIVHDAFEANAFLFKVPLSTPIAAGAQEWYENFCYESNEDAGNEEFKEKCTKLDWFPKRFLETYQVPPSADSAKILSFLNRRYREGGMPIVAVWQKAAIEFLAD